MVTDFERGMELGERVARLVRERNDAIDKLKEQTGAHERCKEALREANETISALQESLARHERGTEVRADGKEVRKDRWEQAFRAISSRFIGCREEFEVEPLTRDILAFLDAFKASNGTLSLTRPDRRAPEGEGANEP